MGSYKDYSVYNTLTLFILFINIDYQINTLPYHIIKSYIITITSKYYHIITSLHYHIITLSYYHIKICLRKSNENS
jgi:hypothetical protein